MDTNWLLLLYSEKFKAVVEKKARKTFCDDPASQEEAFSYVIDKLSENDWERCKKHNGLVSPEAYLMTLCSNLLVEYSRVKFGRLRPPEWLKRQGLVWVSLWKDICLNRENETSVVDRYVTNQNKDQDSIRLAIRTIKSKLPWCGVGNRPQSIDDDFYVETDSIGLSSSTEGTLDTARYEQAVAIAQIMLEEGRADLELSLPSQVAKVQEIASSLEVSPEERLMLRMHYIDGMSHSAIARKLNVAKHVPVRQNKKVLQKFYQLLVAHGIELGSKQ